MCHTLNCVPVSTFERSISDMCINIRAQGLDDNSVMAIVHALQSVDTCEELLLQDNLITNSGAASLAALIQDNQYIHTLDISGNDIRCLGVESIAAALKVGL